MKDLKFPIQSMIMLTSWLL